MQHLLDFIHEHTFEEQLYLVAPSAAGELELLWRRAEAPEHWQLRSRGTEAPWELVPRRELIGDLERRAVDMQAIKRELHAQLAAQIAFAETVLRAADRDLDRELLNRFTLGHQAFIRDLSVAVEQLQSRIRPSLRIVKGGGVQTSAPAGHLSLVR